MKKKDFQQKMINLNLTHLSDDNHTRLNMHKFERANSLMNLDEKKKKKRFALTKRIIRS